MQELNLNDQELVQGGVIPLIAGAVAVSKALGAGFALGMAAGAVVAFATYTSD
ncbi:hypothetical protein [Paraferrimonas haliotis]|uniref:Class IIb bacteriocin, lactobin A/cerein 7B family n=1 Tax=Paraferrimonas haliotis TaxID=2013866 RepID=A0AA37TN98_9GAMM|nr:hypothetical protein [Paraferrimonas haliotis]GLS83548.1 hypothetical protein GCM10007894_15250 [Paraferrimonas haliotis]